MNIDDFMKQYWLVRERAVTLARIELEVRGHWEWLVRHARVDDPTIEVLDGYITVEFAPYTDDAMSVNVGIGRLDGDDDSFKRHVEAKIAAEQEISRQQQAEREKRAAARDLEQYKLLKKRFEGQ